MGFKETEYREMFYAEAFENQEELNKLFTQLEKNPKDKNAIDSIFRITHTLKGNSMGLGFQGIAELSHIMEDMFAMVKENKLELDEAMFKNLFNANDKLGALIDAIKVDKNVSYKGILAKLRIYLGKVVPEYGMDRSEENGAYASNGNGNGSVNGNGAAHAADANSESLTSEEVSDEAEKEDEEKTVSDDRAQIGFSDQVQIPIRKLDDLLNLVGELIIEKDSIAARGSSETRSNEYSRLHRISSDIQYSVMDIRLVQVGFLFNKFHRIVRDVANIESKNVNLVLEGSEIEIDRNVLKTISDSLVHLVRNAVSHGVEDASERTKINKSAIGKLVLRASNDKDSVLIEVEDDGKGIDTKAIKRKAIEKGIVSKEYAETLSEHEIRLLIFEPGFSNAEKITEISGRGVGMDVVKRATESIGGQVMVSSVVGKGTKITLRLPSSMAVKGALLFEHGEQEFAIPLSFTEAVVSLEPEKINKVGKGLMANYLEHTMLVVFLSDLYNLPNLDSSQEEGAMHRTYEKLKGSTQKLHVIVVNYNGKYVGFVVDKLLQQKEIMEKPLAKPLDAVELFTGATILGSGNVCLVLNVATIIDKLFKERRSIKLNFTKAA